MTLLDAGADVNLRASDSSTALIAAVRGERSEIVKLLLSRSANANTVEKMLVVLLLILAIENGDIESITALLKNRVNVDLRDRQAKQLTLATKQNNAPVVDLILNTAVVDVNVPIAWNYTLMVAAEQGDTNTVKSLMEKGANIEAEDAQGRTAFFRAKLAEQTQTMALLTEGKGPLRTSGPINIQSFPRMESHDISAPATSRDPCALLLDVCCCPFPEASGVIKLADQRGLWLWCVTSLYFLTRLRHS